MTHLLHLDASARRASHSRSLSKKFAEQWRVVHPHGAYSYRDLAADPVPPIDEAWDPTLRSRREEYERSFAEAQRAVAELARSLAEPAEVTS